jgi:hypothetical protein
MSRAIFEYFRPLHATLPNEYIGHVAIAVLRLCTLINLARYLVWVLITRSRYASHSILHVGVEMLTHRINSIGRIPEKKNTTMIQ